MEVDSGNLLWHAEFSHIQVQFPSAQERLRNAQCKTEEQDERICLMREHLAQAHQHSTSSQELLRRLEKELEMEISLCRLKAEESHWAGVQSTRMAREVREIQDKIAKWQQMLLGKRQQLTDLRSTLVWESQSCQSWLKASLDKQQQNLQDFQMHKESASLVKKLMSDVEKLQKILGTCTAEREEAIHTYQNLQGELHCMSNEFSSNHEDHQSILKLCEESIKEVDAAETDLDVKDRELQTVRRQAEEIKVSVQRIQYELSILLGSRTELLEQADKLTATSVILSKQLAGLADASHLHSLKQQVGQTSVEVNSLRAVLCKLQDYISQKNQTLCQVKRKVSELEVMVSSAEVAPLSSSSSETECALLQTLVERERKAQISLAQGHLCDTCSIREQSARVLRAKCQALSTQLMNNRVLSEKNDKHLLQKKELADEKANILKSMEVELDHLQDRLRLVLGTKEQTSGAHKTETDRLSKFSRREAMEEASLRASQTSLKGTQEDIQKVQRNLEALKLELAGLQSLALDLDQESDALQRTLCKAIQNNQEFAVEKSLLQVSVRQLQYQLEELGLGLLDTRESSSRSQQDVSWKMKTAKERVTKMQLELNTAQAERGRLTQQLAKDVQKLKSLRSRLDVSVSALPADIQEDQPTSLVNRAVELERAQHVEEAELDLALCQRQEELSAVHGCLAMLQAANSLTRQQSVREPIGEEAELSGLKDRLDGLLSCLLERRRTSQQLASNSAALEFQLSDLESRRHQLQVSMVQAQLQEEQHTRLLSEQKLKIIRADGMVQKLVEESTLSRNEMETKQKYLEMSMLRSVHHHMVNFITRVARKEPDFYVKLHLLLDKK